MNKRSMLSMLIAGASLHPMLACALGLGDIQLDSRLNQPLRARIEVIDASDQEWRQIHTRLNWQGTPDAVPLHSELLDAITLRAVEDAGQRRFIEVRTAIAVTEPLFDLPIEVATTTARIVRNYSILLDPPASGEDLPLQAPAPRPVSAQQAIQTPDTLLTPQIAQAAVGEETAGTRPIPRASNRATRHRHRHRRHAGATPNSASHSTVSAQRAPVPEPMRSQQADQQQPQQTDRRPLQQADRRQLEKQLDVLQQTLEKMQATIAAQNAQIVDLTARIAAQGAATVARPSSGPHKSRESAQFATSGATSPSTAASAARVVATTAAEVADSDPDDSDSTAPARKSHLYFWGGALGVTVSLAVLFAWLMRRREIRPASPIRPTVVFPSAAASVRTPPQKQGEAPPQRQSDAPRHRYGGNSPPKPASEASRTEWNEELWGKPDWLRVFGDQQTTAQQHSELDTEQLPAAYLEEMPKAYFADLPKTAVQRAQAEATNAQRAQTARAEHTGAIDADYAEALDTGHTEPGDTGETEDSDSVFAQTTRLTETDARALRELEGSYVDNPQQRADEDDPEKTPAPLAKMTG